MADLLCGPAHQYAILPDYSSLQPVNKVNIPYTYLNPSRWQIVPALNRTTPCTVAMTGRTLKSFLFAYLDVRGC